ncbi:retrovirus-related pol polyprotein from transposon TNT 1-94 [Tanacetum coccineum]
MYRIDTRTTQTKALQLHHTSRNTNPRVSTSTGVIHITSVSRSQLRGTQMKEKLMHNNSQVKSKKIKVEDHHRISSISNKTKSVSACNDNLKSRTLNVNVVCVSCEKYVFNSNHDASVSKFINDVNARTKKPKVVPIISLQELNSSTPICFMAKASPTQAWLWHRRLSHLHFDYINLLSKKDITKAVPSLKGRLNLLHMDLCGPMRVESINGKKYIMVIIDGYSRYTWTLFIRSKDETPEVLKDFLKMIQRNLQAQVIIVRTDRGTEFLNKTLHAYFKEEGIEHQTSTPRTPEQNGVVERQNRTLVEVARTMLLASKLPLFFWAEAIATTCYTQNRSIIIPTHEKTAYHIINDMKYVV